MDADDFWWNERVADAEFGARQRAAMDRLDDLVDQWHKTPLDNPMDLPEFLGMTEDEYRAWLKDPTDMPPRYLT